MVVAATGVTDGALLKGVKFSGDIIETETIVFRSLTGTVRRIAGEHRSWTSSTWIDPRAPAGHPLLTGGGQASMPLDNPPAATMHGGGR